MDLTTATARNLRARLDVTDAVLTEARRGDHGPAAAYAAEAFREALRQVERRELAADEILRAMTSAAAREIEAARGGFARHPDSFDGAAYSRTVTAIGQAAETASFTGQILAGILGAPMDGRTLEEVMGISQ
jgi:hypothetical protein